MGTFNILTAILVGNASLGTFISASLLNVNVFITCGLIVGIYVMLVPLVASFPRDRPTPSQTYNEGDASGEECRSLMPDNALAISVPHGASSSPMMEHGNALGAHKTPKGPVPTMFRALVRAATVDLHLSIQLVLQTIRHPFTRPVMILYFGTTLASCISLTTQQWASSTFHTSISNIDKVTAMEQIISAATLLALPWLARYFLHPRLHTKKAVDFAVVLGSLMVTIVGVLIIASAPSLLAYGMGVAVAATGIGLSDALRSLATTALSDKDLVQKLYMSIRTVQTLAAMIGAPLWSGFFVWLLDHPSVSRGTLYLGHALIMFLCLLLAISLQRSR